MAEYTAREWSNGDIVTASNLNQIENGVETVAEESEFLAVNTTEVTENETTNLQLDKTWQQIYDAFPKVYITWTENEDYNFLKSNIDTVYEINGVYTAIFCGNRFIAESPNDYPRYIQDK